MGAPTLIVGLGGIGGNVVQRLSDRIKEEGVTDVELAVMDTDVNDLRRFNEEYPNIYTVQTSPKGTVGKALDHNKFALEKWFPVNDGLVGKPFTEGAGQVRAVSRLAFDYAVEQGLMENLEKAIAKLHGLTGNVMRQEMRIVIVGSIAGGTGSGLVLPAAMYIRNFLITRYQDSSAIIRGFFLEPDVVFGRLPDEKERNYQRANAYAALRELNAFFRKEHAGDGGRYKHVVFNAPQPGLGVRVDYPNILPYNYVFLMDALNEKGDSLTDSQGRYDLEAYKQHAADCIYAMSLSPLSSRTNSSEDNMVRAVAASEGLSRYCGAGSSRLEYPKAEVQRYVALNWATRTISGEWLEIDDDYERMVREDPELNLSQFYRTEYEGKRTSNSPFYKTIVARTEIRGQDGVVIDRVQDFIGALEGHAKTWAGEQLYRQSTTLYNARYDDRRRERLGMLTVDADAILDECREQDDAAGMMRARLTRFFDNARLFSRAAQEEVADIAKGAARSAFQVGEYEDRPLEHRDKEWQLEHVFRALNQDGSIGSYHPAYVRYALYRTIELLENKCKLYEDNARKAKQNMANAEVDDYYDGNEGKDDVNAAVSLIFASDDQGRRKLSIPFLSGKSGSIGSEEAEQLATISSKLVNYRNEILKYIDATVGQAFFENALNYTRGLSHAYETFYKLLRKEIDDMRGQIGTIEGKRAYNQPKGRSHRYVCADKGSLAAIMDKCPMKGSSGDLPPELCGDIYSGLLRYARRTIEIGAYAERNDVARTLFRDLFQEVVVNYWNNRVLDQHLGYPEVVDKGIIQAIADEAIYKATYVDGELFANKAQEVEVAQVHINHTLEEAQRLSTAFIEPPTDQAPRPIQSCAYSAAAFEDAGSYADETAQLLANSFNGVAVDPREFSKYEIQFYSSLYGLRADTLPKYAPVHEGKENRPEGEYFRAYYEMVDKLSPNLQENKIITPHIDKNWHLVSCLPDLNEANERSIQHDIVRSYLYSLIFRQFGSETVVDADDIFYLKATEGRLRTRLWVSNGTPCDRFYEVFDSLKFSPPAIKVLLESAAKRQIAESNKNSKVTVSNCDLVANIKSHAYSDYDFDEWRSKIVGGIGNAEVLDEPDMQALISRFDPYDGAMDSMIVTNLFFYGLEDNERYRHGRASIFDIPLLYRISLPQTETQEGEIDMMIESIFQTVDNYLSRFSEGAELRAACCQLFEEQYMLFEWNLIGYDSVFRGLHANQVVSSIREKLHSYLEESGSPRARRIDMLQPTIQEAWKQVGKRM